MIGEIIPQILGIELASFLDKKSRYLWKRLGASFLDLKSNVIDCIRFGGFLKKSFWEGQGASFMDKKLEHILKNGLDFLSRNDASSIPRNWILCPEFTDRG